MNAQSDSAVKRCRSSRVKPPTLRDWFLKRKHLDFVKVGRAVCVTEESIERFIAANTIPAREGR